MKELPEILRDPLPEDEAVFHAVLDDRYIVQVQRVEPYVGKLCIFDMQQNNKMLVSWDVAIRADALFGVDMIDAEYWAQQCQDWVDEYDKTRKD